MIGIYSIYDVVVVLSNKLNIGKFVYIIHFLKSNIRNFNHKYYAPYNTNSRFFRAMVKL